MAIFLVAMALAGCARTARIKYVTAKESALVSVPEKPEEKEAAAPPMRFKVGERGTYIVAWKGIPVGTVTSTINDIIDFNGREVYVIELVARTNKFLDKIYRIEDRYITYLDTRTFTSRHYEAVRREGNYKKDLVVTYDFEKNAASYKNLRDGTVKTCSIIDPVQDPLSAVYFCRTIPINLGETVDFFVNLNEKNYHVYARVEKEVVMNLPEIGTYEAFLVTPYVTLDGTDIKKGRAWGYISCGESRYLIYGIVKIPWIGEVTATLKSIEHVSLK